MRTAQTQAEFDYIMEIEYEPFSKEERTETRKRMFCTSYRKYQHCKDCPLFKDFSYEHYVTNWNRPELAMYDVAHKWCDTEKAKIPEPNWAKIYGVDGLDYDPFPV